MSAITKLNVKMFGDKSPTLVFIHGYGCDQTMWRFVAPKFPETYRTVTYDLVGMGRSDHNAYDFQRYKTLEAHADDLGILMNELDIADAILVGHSVGATIACLASLRQLERVKGLVLVAPSPCFINDADYIGGFDRESLEGLIDTMEQNFLGWTEQVTPIIAGQAEDGNLTAELSKSFCQTDPAIAKHFGRVTFLADHRKEMPEVSVPTLVIQCSNDILAPTDVGEWLADSIGQANLSIIEATGHCPHITEPEKTTHELRSFLEQFG